MSENNECTEDILRPVIKFTVISNEEKFRRFEPGDVQHFCFMVNFLTVHNLVFFILVWVHNNHLHSGWKFPKYPNDLK